MGFDLRRALGGIPVLGPIEKGIFGDPDEENLQKQIKHMQEAYQAYRPQIADARMQGLGNQLSVYGPVNDLLARMYGPGAQIPTQQLMQNPMANIFAKPPGPPGKAPDNRTPITPYSIEPNTNNLKVGV